MAKYRILTGDDIKTTFGAPPSHETVPSERLVMQLIDSRAPNSDAGNTGDVLTGSDDNAVWQPPINHLNATIKGVLDARQGKALKTLIDTKAPINDPIFGGTVWMTRLQGADNTLDIGNSIESLYVGNNAIHISVGENAQGVVELGTNADDIRMGMYCNTVQIGTYTPNLNIGEGARDLYIGSFAEEINVGIEAIHLKLHGKTETSVTSTNENRIYIQKPDGTLAHMSKTEFKTWLNN